MIQINYRDIFTFCIIFYGLENFVETFKKISSRERERDLSEKV